MNLDYIEFLMECEKLRTIYRRTKNISNDQRENGSEHSHHICLFALILEEYSAGADICKVLKMLIIHDLIEIYAGDTFAYHEEARATKEKREREAAEKLYSMLPKSKRDELYELWYEFEAMETQESLYANAMDRLQPILMNYYSQGGTWVEYGISVEQLEKRVEPIKACSPQLKDFIEKIIDEASDRGYIDGL